MERAGAAAVAAYRQAATKVTQRAADRVQQLQTDPGPTRTGQAAIADRLQ